MMVPLRFYNDSSFPTKVSQEGQVPSSYASMFKNNSPKKRLRFQNSDCVAGANVTIPLKVVDEVSNRFVNTPYGYLIGLSRFSNC